MRLIERRVTRGVDPPEVEGYQWHGWKLIMIAKLNTDGTFHSRKWSCVWRPDIGSSLYARSDWMRAGGVGGVAWLQTGTVQNYSYGTGSSEVHVPLADHMGNVRHYYQFRASGSKVTGQLVASYEYDAFGREVRAWGLNTRIRCVRASSKADFRFQADAEGSQARSALEFPKRFSRLRHRMHFWAMNVETIYILTEDRSSVVAAIKERLIAEVGSQSNAPLPSSYDPLLRTDAKRQVLVSPPQHGWVTVLEAKEVVDFDLAQRLSEQIKTVVLIVQLAEGVGARGMAMLKDGTVLFSDYSEGDDDPSGTIQNFMSQNGIVWPLLMFREAIALRDQGWASVTR